MKKQYFITIDTETTQDHKVADFAAVISDRRGRIVTQCAVLVNGIFTDSENHPLFFDSKLPADAAFSRKSADRRYKKYQAMVNAGSRQIASVNAINRWLEKAAAQYDPVLTAYNLSFDTDKCLKTEIDLTVFSQSFCLWQAAWSIYAKKKAFRQMVLDTHAFNDVTPHGNMTFKTNAETMARFVLGNPELPDEPHTALEDIIFYELPILNRMVKNYKTQDIIDRAESYEWRKAQVKDWFKPA